MRKRDQLGEVQMRSDPPVSHNRYGFRAEVSSNVIIPNDRQTLPLTP